MGELMPVKNLTRKQQKKRTKQHQKKTEAALAGNRTPVSRVAGENSTTEPPTPALTVVYRRCL